MSGLYETEEGCKIWRGIDLLFQNWHKEFNKLWPEHSKVSKIFFLMCFFWAKYIYIVQAKKVQRSYLSWNWRGIQNLERNWLVVQNWCKQFDNFFTWALESLKSFHFNSLLLSKKYIVWAKEAQMSYLSWN